MAKTLDELPDSAFVRLNGCADELDLHPRTLRHYGKTGVVDLVRRRPKLLGMTAGKLRQTKATLNKPVR